MRNDTSPPPPPPPPGPVGGTPSAALPRPARPRIGALDVLRGVALCAILVANVQLIAGGGTAVATPTLGSAQGWIGLPVFSLLFGIGFALLLESATETARRPRLVLLRRLLALLAFGLLHRLLWPGDILTVYAAVGLVVLLPSSWLPRWAVAGGAAVLVPAALVFGVGGPLLIAGLFLLGSALVRYGVVAGIERSTWWPAALGLAFAAASAGTVWTAGQVGITGEGPSPVLAAADLLRTAACVCGLLVLLRTPLRPVLAAVFAPLGRMALTVYLSATLLVLGAARVLGLPIAQDVRTALLVTGAVLLVQWLFCALWLRRCRQGPLEWVWRWATWARRPPLRVREPAAGAAAGQAAGR
ncbi:DUF418 domain-containing protein [Streptomonospora sp. S1-112]|uniref:DUF418 domain-containing protein n=1 Tax=Streptomonospora mangrovi TaxID=2883123 RepID=A0A9X3SCF7_9ACTN|nr:DUF418 domain-containing protein [Streptomonospora mangrovi]MDA0563608.1 DUF418 domain-containing protein [Streptomonospora mangrovi]